jgi:hypothetical protein
VNETGTNYQKHAQNLDNYTRERALEHEDVQDHMLGISGPQNAKFQALKLKCEEQDQMP